MKGPQILAEVTTTEKNRRSGKFLNATWHVCMEEDQMIGMLVGETEKAGTEMSAEMIE